jgi:hypothetical protein
MRLHGDDLDFGRRRRRRFIFVTAGQRDEENCEQSRNEERPQRT